MHTSSFICGQAFATGLDVAEVRGQHPNAYGYYPNLVKSWMLAQAPNKSMKTEANYLRGAPHPCGARSRMVDSEPTGPSGRKDLEIPHHTTTTYFAAFFMSVALVCLDLWYRDQQYAENPSAQIKQLYYYFENQNLQ